MKKTVIFVLSVFMIICLSACGKKTQKLVCTQNVDGVDRTINVVFEGDKVKTMDFSYTSDLSEYTDEQLEVIKKQDYCTSIKNAMSDYSEAFSNCKNNIEDKKLSITANLDVSKIAKSTLDKMTSIESSKESLEASGYTCTIN